jgi:hypothetical protein
MSPQRCSTQPSQRRGVPLTAPRHARARVASAGRVLDSTMLTTSWEPCITARKEVDLSTLKSSFDHSSSIQIMTWLHADKRGAGILRGALPWARLLHAALPRGLGITETSAQYSHPKLSAPHGPHPPSRAASWARHPSRTGSTTAAQP